MQDAAPTPCRSFVALSRVASQAYLSAGSISARRISKRSKLPLDVVERLDSLERDKARASKCSGVRRPAGNVPRFRMWGPAPLLCTGEDDRSLADVASRHPIGRNRRYLALPEFYPP